MKPLALRTLLVALALTAPSCSLIANPNDHLGGTTEDTGIRVDGGGVDASGDAGIDTGEDAGPPPPECSSAAECGTGPVDCVSARCVFCAAPLAEPVVIASDTELVREFGMAVGTEGATSEVLLAYVTGRGTSSFRPSAAFTRTDAVSPTAPAGSSSALGGIEMISGARFDTLDSLDVDGRFFDTSRGGFGVSVLGTDGTSTVRTYVVSETDTLVTSGTYPGADTVAAPAADLAPLRMADTDSVFGGTAVYRAQLADGSVVLRSVETSYGNANGEWAGPALPSDPFAPIAVAHGLVAIGTTDEKVALWDLGTDPGVLIDTPGRTGAPGIVEVSTGVYVLAYGAGSRIVLRSIECTGPSSTCAALTSSLEIETGAASIPRVELTRSGDVVAIVSYEAAAGGVGGQLALRAVRADLSRAYHATTGDALTLEAFPGGSARLITDVHHALAAPASGDRYVVGWMRASAAAGAIVDLRLQSIGTTCM